MSNTDFKYPLDAVLQELKENFPHAIPHHAQDALDSVEQQAVTLSNTLSLIEMIRTYLLMNIREDANMNAVNDVMDMINGNVKSVMNTLDGYSKKIMTGDLV